MRKISITIVLILLNNMLIAQVGTLQPPSPPDEQSTSTQKFWIEYKNGMFKARFNRPSEAIADERFVLQTMLYDTGRHGPPSIIVHDDPGTRSHDNSQQILPPNKQIHVLASVPEVMAGDMMVFALTYKTITSDTADAGPKAGPLQEKKYFVVLLYNQKDGNDFFNEVNNLTNISGTNVTPARSINGETVTTGGVEGLNSILRIDESIFGRYKYFVLFNDISPTQFERNLFVSITPSGSLTEGMSTAVRALLVEKSGTGDAVEYTLKDSYDLGGLQVALAHDPNYLKVSPTCIESKKRGGHKIRYLLHFQNTGAGPADTVRVTINLPKGMNLDKFDENSIDSVFYGGTDFKHKLFVINIDKANNKMVFKFNPYDESKNQGLSKTTEKVFLIGTDGCVNPFADKRTMGHIVFYLTTTDDADSVLNADASIEFYSKSYTDTRVSEQWEKAVKTNMATVKIAACCDCSKCNCHPDEGCYKIAGLCWWWWIIIFLVLTLIYILLRKKRKNEETDNAGNS